MLWRSHSPSGGMSLPLTLLLEVRQQEIVGKRLVIGQKIWYHTRVKSQAISVHRNLYESENLLSYKGEVKGRVWSLSPFPRPPQPAWTRVERHTVPRTASKSYQYIGRTRGSQPPSDAMSLPITSHPSPGADGSPRKECAYEAVLLR